MKTQIKSFIAASAVVLMLASCSSQTTTNVFEASTVSRAEVLAGQTVYKPSQKIEDMELVVQQGHTAMYADKSTGYFAIEDLRNGKLWYSNPVDAENDTYAQSIYKNWLYSQVILVLTNPSTSTTSTKNSYISSLKRGGVSVETLEDGIRVTYSFVKEAVTLSASYRLTDDGFFATVDTNSIVETGDDLVYNIKLLPMFGAQYYGQEGWMLVPDGSGAIINFDDDRALDADPYRMKVYGNDPVIPAESENNFQETLSMPVLGVSAENGGLLIIADEGAANAYANGVCSRQLTGYNVAYFDFDVRITQNSVIGDLRSYNYKQVVTYEKGAVTSGTVSVRYLLLQQDESSLTQMAKVMRQYILTQRESAVAVSEQAPLFLKVLCGTKQEKSLLGVPVKLVHSMTTLEQASDIAEELEQDGVSGIQMSLQQWSGSQLNGEITTSVDLCGKFGSKAELSALSKQLDSMDGSLYLQTTLDFYTNSGNGIRKNGDSIRDLNGAVSKQPRYLRDVYYPSATGTTDRILNAFKAVLSAKSFAAELASVFPDVGMEISDLGNVLGGDYSDEGLRRQDTEAYYRQTVSELSEKTALLGSAANLYSLYDLSAAYCLPDSASEYEVIACSVPFMSLTLRGIMDIGSRPINASGSYQDAFLHCIASGESPTYELIYDMPLSLKGTELSEYYGADFEAWESIIAQQYEQYAAVYAATCGSEVTGYEVLDNGLIKTTYANGVITLVNTGDTAVNAGSVTVEANAFFMGTNAAFILTGGDMT